MKDARFPKFVLMVNGLVPLAFLSWDATRHDLGPHPANRALHVTGLTALIFLVLTLCVTPLRKLSGYNFLSHFRRMLGLLSFFYALVHLGVWYVADRGMNLRSALIEAFNLHNTFILVGMITLTMMIPLAITSTHGMIKRMGAAKWKNLHRLVYVCAIGAAVHFYLTGKIATTLAMTFAWIVGVLLGYRVIEALRKKAARPKLVATNS
jgi:sulfoxide reductase heme-binding subunit YedZ